MSEVEHTEQPENAEEQAENAEEAPAPKREKKLLNPETNILQISTRRGHRFYTFLAKIFLKSFEDVEFHALGQATGMCARLAESMQRLGFATITKIQTNTHMPKQTLNGPRRYKKIKMIIKMHRDENFEELCGDELKVAQ
jgi:hypothetical protein